MEVGRLKMAACWRVKRGWASAGVKGKLWATFVPAEPPPADLKAMKPRGVSIVARDFQTVALYKADGSFAGIRRPGSNKPIEVRAALLCNDRNGSR